MRDKGFEVTVPNKVPNEEQEKREQFLRPDESDRIARARAWLRVARGQSPATNLQTEVLRPLEVIAFRTLSQPGRSPQQTADDEHEALVYLAFALAEILGKDHLSC